MITSKNYFPCLLLARGTTVENQFRTKTAFYRIFDELERGALYTPHVIKSGIELTYPPDLCYFPIVIKNLKSIFKVGKLSQKMTISKMETVIN